MKCISFKCRTWLGDSIDINNLVIALYEINPPLPEWYAWPSTMVNIDEQLRSVAPLGNEATRSPRFVGPIVVLKVCSMSVTFANTNSLANDNTVSLVLVNDVNVTFVASLWTPTTDSFTCEPNVDAYIGRSARPFNFNSLSGNAKVFVLRKSPSNRKNSVSF